MTQQRRDSHSTEFGLWLRDQPEIDSRFGFVATNLDFVWSNYNTGEYLFIEEKRFHSDIKFYQERIFKSINEYCSLDKNYKGFFLLQFENTNPDDGKIFLNKNEISASELIDFLKFSYVPKPYYTIVEVCF